MKTRNMFNKKFYFLLAFLLSVTVTFALTSCGDDDEPQPPTNTEQPKTEEPAPNDSIENTPTDEPEVNDSTENETPEVPVVEQPASYVGGDISMLLRYEEQHAAYADVDGNAVGNVLDFLKAQGWNTMRVRLFVDPSKDSDKGVCQDLDYVKNLGKRIKDAGLLFMLDFHYSDTWADPAKQWTPDAWKALSNEQLYEKIYEYTKDCLQQLVAAGARPDLIQTGNEISYGMMWGTQSAVGGNNTNRCFTNSSQANWTRFITLLKQAGKACREVCPEAKIIIHSERTPKPEVLTDFFDRMKSAALDYDIIGLSYYPYFHGTLNALDAALGKLEGKGYDKQIQIVETGYPSQWEVPGSEYNYTSVYPYSTEGQRRFTADLVALLKKHSQVNGISWWYPEANAKGCTGNLKEGWYNAGLFDNSTGKALPALYELKGLAE